MIINAEEMAMQEIVDLASDMMADWSSSRNKQKNFVLEYTKSNFGNATEAARQAGYSEKTANQQANKLLNTPHIREVLVKLQEAYEERAAELSIASSVEIKQYLTRVMRGQETEQTLIDVNKGKQAITDIDVNASNRIRAAELLGKSQKLFTDKVEHENSIPVTIIDDIPSDNDDTES